MKKFCLLLVVLVTFAWIGPLQAQDAPKEEPKPAAPLTLKDQLLSQDPAVVLKARQDAVADGAKALPALLELLKDANAELRFTAVELLGQINDASVAPQILPLLDDTGGARASVASVAAKVLGKFQCKEALPKFLAALKSPDIELRYESIKALGNLGAAEAEEQLIEMLKNQYKYKTNTVDGYSQVCAIIEALGKTAAKKKYVAANQIGPLLDSKDIEPTTELPASHYAARAMLLLTATMPEFTKPPTIENPVPDPQQANKLVPDGPLTGSVDAVKKTLEEWKSWWSKNKDTIDKAAKAEEEPPKPPEQKPPEQKPPQDVQKPSDQSQPPEPPKPPDQQPPAQPPAPPQQPPPPPPPPSPPPPPPPAPPEQPK